ncbi:hypothetical protein [Paraburkholderia bannensis]|uniref:hypothetical protein n=1 Tax=Paraburkholderia bannensis TaxID=765414 RepID=UPI002AB7431B|nr:hypothetical protein [Paraburkholderia bannensis]
MIQNRAPHFCLVARYGGDPHDLARLSTTVLARKTRFLTRADLPDSLVFRRVRCKKVAHSSLNRIASDPRSRAMDDSAAAIAICAFSFVFPL